MKTSRESRRIMNFESMEKRELFAADLGFDLGTPAPEPQAAILVLIPGVGGDSTIDGYDEGRDGSAGKEWHDTKPMGWDNTTHKKWADSGISFNRDDAKSDYFVADSFSFGVEREMKESGEKGGTADINIGVGELQECTVSKSMDIASGKLAQYSINGNSPGTAEIDFVEVAGGGETAAAVFAKYDGIDGEAKGGNAETTWKVEKGEKFTADSFSFGVEREMKESGEKGGTADINIGVGELQECTVSKSMDTTAAVDALFAA